MFQPIIRKEVPMSKEDTAAFAAYANKLNEERLAKAKRENWEQTKKTR